MILGWNDGYTAAMGNAAAFAPIAIARIWWNAKHHKNLTKMLANETIGSLAPATKMDVEIVVATAKHEILKWVRGMIIAQTTLLITAFGIGIALLK